MGLTIAELPFRERPALELLALDGEREAPQHDYAGYGWARLPRVWIGTDADLDGGEVITDALVLALHSPDDSPPRTDDIELELELPDGSSVLVLLSAFLATWLPRLPRTSAIVLALCNPHRAVPTVPADLGVPVHYPLGDVTSWIDRGRGDRVELVADSWGTLRA